MRIAVVPSGWKLPRSFRIEKRSTGSLLRTDFRPPPNPEDTIERTGRSEWRIVLRWSQEALAIAAYAMTFWYMERVGEGIYRSGVPRAWSEMTPAEAGRNAVKRASGPGSYSARTGRLAGSRVIVGASLSGCGNQGRQETD